MANHTMFHSSVAHMTTAQLDQAVQLRRTCCMPSSASIPRRSSIRLAAPGHSHDGVPCGTLRPGVHRTPRSHRIDCRSHVCDTHSSQGIRDSRTGTCFDLTLRGSVHRRRAGGQDEARSSEPRTLVRRQPERRRQPRRSRLQTRAWRILTSTACNCRAWIADQFAMQANGCASAVLLPGNTCTVRVVFAPTSAGQKRADLEIDSNDAALTGAFANYQAQGFCRAGDVDRRLDARPNATQPFSFTATNGIAPFTLTDDGTGRAALDWAWSRAITRSGLGSWPGGHRPPMGAILAQRSMREHARYMCSSSPARTCMYLYRIACDCPMNRSR